MKFMVTCPVESTFDGAWLDPQNLIRFAQAAEAAGFDGLAFTDHPAPSRKWLNGGGHESYDPFAALCFIAACTKTMRLATYLAVAPYRNPLLQAKSMATVDILSKGRATFTLGAGYLRSEFSALGVDMEERVALMDEVADVVRNVFTADEFSYKGRHFEARGVGMAPSPVQLPHPPLWLGGNSGLVLNRVAQWAQGWAVMAGSPTVAATARTRSVSTPEDLAEALADLSRRMEPHGRKLSDIDVHFSGEMGRLGVDLSTQARIDQIGGLAALGVTWVGVSPPHMDVDGAIESLQRFGQDVIAKSR